MRHADYEIYTFIHNGIKYWAFDVEYFGHYVAKSEKEILRKVDATKLKVQLRLQEIDKLNKEYYKRLEAQEKAQQKSLKDYRKYKNNLLVSMDLNEKRYKKEQNDTIRSLLLAGMNINEILKMFPNVPRRTIAQVYSHLQRKNLL